MFLETVDSTQALARREVAAGRAGVGTRSDAVAFVAREQTAGVGQRGRAWSSPIGGLWMTVCVPVTRPPAGELGLRIGWAVLNLCRELVPAQSRARLKLKWPNDIMLDDGKLGGILVESAASPRCVLAGVGVNLAVDRAAFPLELSTSAATFDQLAPDATPKNSQELQVIAARWADELAHVIAPSDGSREVDGERDGSGTVHPTLTSIAADLWRLGEATTYFRPDGSIVRGELTGLAAGGALELMTSSGRIELISGTSEPPREGGRMA